MALQRLTDLIPSLVGQGAVDCSSKRENLLIVLPIPEPEDEIEALRIQFPKFKIHYHQLRNLVNQPGEYKRTFDDALYRDCTILFTLFALPPKGREDAPNLHWVHFFSAGVNTSLNHPIWKDESVRLTTSSGVHGPQIAEWFLMTLLAQNHAFNSLYEWQKKHEWGEQITLITRVKDLVNQRVGVLGYGSIGRQVARVAKAMGMDVYAYTATPKDTKQSRRDEGFIVPGTGDPEGEYPSKWFSGLELEPLHHFLEQDLDILLIAVPLTDQTKHFLSTPEFDILAKKRTYISNISRGQIIDQPALIEALQKEKLRGAALDVTDPEPLPKDSPLWDLPNVTITPHVSGVGSAYVERCFAILIGNLMRDARGEKLWNVVDRKKGY